MAVRTPKQIILKKEGSNWLATAHVPGGWITLHLHNINLEGNGAHFSLSYVLAKRLSSRYSPDFTHGASVTYYLGSCEKPLIPQKNQQHIMYSYSGFKRISGELDALSKIPVAGTTQFVDERHVAPVLDEMTRYILPKIGFEEGENEAQERFKLLLRNFLADRLDAKGVPGKPRAMAELSNSFRKAFIKSKILALNGREINHSTVKPINNRPQPT